MPAAKDRQFRLAIIDEALQDATKKDRPISKEALVQKVRRELESRGLSCSKSTVEHDLTHIKRTFRHSVEVKEIRINGRAHYAYTNRDMGIKRGMLTQKTFEELSRALTLMEKFVGLEGFEPVEELVAQLRGLFESSSTYIENFLLDYADAAGRKFVGRLIAFIRDEVILKIEYREFGGESHEFYFHPHILKEYNGRWYCFGYNQTNDEWKFKVALDRVVSIRPVNRQDTDEVPEMDWNYRTQSFEYDDVGSWEEYFSHFMGPTVKYTESGEMAEPITIKLRFRKSRVGYVFTKPLHGTQEPHDAWPSPDVDGWYPFEYTIVPTKEFYSRLLEFGPDMEVVNPKSVRDEVIDRIRRMSQIYED